jgi:hypothetical protein
MAVARRELTFNDLDEVVRDAEQLLARGYDRAGHWDLAQVCDHVGNWMRYAMDGFPRAPLPIRGLLWALRKTIGKRKLADFLATGKMPAGKPTLRQSVPPPGGDPAAAVARLRATVARMTAHAGPLKPSPLFGDVTRDEWVRLNLVHAAHHLSFLVPRQP